MAQQGLDKTLRCQFGEVPTKLLACEGWDCAALFPSATLHVEGTWLATQRPPARKEARFRPLPLAAPAACCLLVHSLSRLPFRRSITFRHDLSPTPAFASFLSAFALPGLPATLLWPPFC